MSSEDDYSVLSLMDHAQWLRTSVRPKLDLEDQPRILAIAEHIGRLVADRVHSWGCEHSVDPPRRCSEGTCYRQWQADEIERLRAESRRFFASMVRWSSKRSEMQAEIERLQGEVDSWRYWSAVTEKAIRDAADDLWALRPSDSDLEADDEQ